MNPASHQRLRRTTTQKRCTVAETWDLPEIPSFSSLTLRTALRYGRMWRPPVPVYAAGVGRVVDVKRGLVPSRRLAEAGCQRSREQLLSCHRVSSPKAKARQLNSRKFPSILGTWVGGGTRNIPPGGAFARAIPAEVYSRRR